MFAEAYDDELMEAYDDERFDDESSDDEARPPARFRSRPRLPSLRAQGGQNTPTGVDRLVVNTPKGTMTLHLQEKLVRDEGLKAALVPVQSAINQHASRLNSTQADIAGLSRRVTTSMQMASKDIKKLKQAQSDSMMFSLLPLLLTGSSTGTGTGGNTGLLLAVMMMSGGLGGSGGDSGGNNMMLPLLLLTLR